MDGEKVMEAKVGWMFSKIEKNEKAGDKKNEGERAKQQR